MNVTEVEILSYLTIATEKGFLTRRASGDFSFAHELIVDTLIQKIPTEQREEFNYKVGRRLWQYYDLQKLDENILVVTHLLLMGERYIVKDRERIAVAKLCLRSGEQSIHISSFRTALNYIMSGIQLAGKDCWHNEYQLALDLHNAAAELAYCTGKGSTALDISNTIAMEARCFDDALTGHDIKIRALGSVGKVQESMDFGFMILAQLGEAFPANPSMIRCYVGLQMVRQRLKSRTSESLLRLPLMTDRRKTAAVKMMNQLFTICLQVNPLLAILLAFRVVSRTLDFGISATSCLGFVTLGAMLGG
jgi:predicted ATPase